MERIPSSEIIFHPLSFADPSGRVFSWRGQLYRAITVERASLYKRIFGAGIVHELLEKNLLVNSELTTLSLDGFDLIIKHKTISFVSYPYEWSGVMLKDAALTVLDVAILLAKHNLTLQDAHPWNVLFDGYHPLYIDFGSIVTSSDIIWPSYDEFCRFFIFPLQLMSHGHGRIARWLLHEHETGVLQSEVNALMQIPPKYFEIQEIVKSLKAAARQWMPPPLYSAAKEVQRCLRALLPRSTSTKLTLSLLEFLERIRQEIENIQVQVAETMWTNYYEETFPAFGPSDDWNAKHHSVYQVLSDTRPDSVLDIGSNRGWFSQLAAVLGSDVVAFDVDESASTRLYLDAKEKGLSLLPLIMNFTNPSPGYGLCNEWLAPAIDRLRVDMVLALALVHHLVFKQHLRFEQIVKGLSAFSQRWLLVEFIPREDRYVSEWWTQKFIWYTFENFVDALKREFFSVTPLSSYPDPRVLLLCEK